MELHLSHIRKEKLQHLEEKKKIGRRELGSVLQLILEFKAAPDHLPLFSDDFSEYWKAHVNVSKEAGNIPAFLLKWF